MTLDRLNTERFLEAKGLIKEMIVNANSAGKSINWKRQWATKSSNKSEYARMMEYFLKIDNKPKTIFHVESIVERYLKSNNIIFDYKAKTIPKFEYAHDELDRTKDRLSMVKLENCHNNSAYYSTLFHELIHTTGVIQRLNRPSFRQGRSPKGSNMKEEIIAELGAVFLSVYYKLENIDYINHAGYIKSWFGKTLSIEDIDNVYDDTIEAIKYLLKYMKPHDFKELISKPNLSWSDLMQYYS